MNKKSILTLLAKAERLTGHTPSMAAHVVHKDCLRDDFILSIVERVLSSNSNQEERTEAMLRLLGSYGVGTVVMDRLV
jgi:hypothetical protein